MKLTFYRVNPEKTDPLKFPTTRGTDLESTETLPKDTTTEEQMRVCSTEEMNSQLKLSTLSTTTRRKMFTMEHLLVTDPDLQQTMLVSKLDNTSISLA